MTWDYLAGFTDGDGGIDNYLRPGRRRKARIRWHQKAASSQVLDAIAVFLRAEGVKVCECNFSVCTKGHKYPQRGLILNGIHALHAIKKMEPYLVLKRDLANSIIADYGSRT